MKMFVLKMFIFFFLFKEAMKIQIFIKEEIKINENKIILLEFLSHLKRNGNEVKNYLEKNSRKKRITKDFA